MARLIRSGPRSSADGVIVGGGGAGSSPMGRLIRSALSAVDDSLVTRKACVVAAVGDGVQAVGRAVTTTGLWVLLRRPLRMLSRNIRMATMPMNPITQQLVMTRPAMRPWSAPPLNPVGKGRGSSTGASGDRNGDRGGDPGGRGGGDDGGDGGGGGDGGADGGGGTAGGGGDGGGGEGPSKAGCSTMGAATLSTVSPSEAESSNVDVEVICSAAACAALVLGIMANALTSTLPGATMMSWTFCTGVESSAARRYRKARRAPASNEVTEPLSVNSRSRVGR